MSVDPSKLTVPELKLLALAQSIDNSLLREFADRVAMLNSVSEECRYLVHFRDAAVAAGQIRRETNAHALMPMRRFEQAGTRCTEALRWLNKPADAEKLSFDGLYRLAEHGAMPAETAKALQSIENITEAAANVRDISEIFKKIEQPLREMAKLALTLPNHYGAERHGPSR